MNFDAGNQGRSDNSRERNQYLNQRVTQHEGLVNLESRRGNLYGSNSVTDLPRQQ